MKKLLQINVVVNTGSTGHIAEDIGFYVKKNGWKSYIAYARHKRSSRSKLIKIGSKWGILWHVLQTRLWDRHGLASKKATRDLVKEIENIRPDIIHLHVIHGYYINYKILFQYLKSKNIPIVWTLHDCWNFTGHCAYYSAAKCDKWQGGCKRCPQIKTYPKSFIIDRSMKNWISKKESFSVIKNLTLVTVSNWLTDEVKKSFLASNKIKRIYNGVNTNLFTLRMSSIKEKLGIQDKMMILGVANIWNKRKGLDDFCKLAKKLSSSHVIVLIGLSNQQIKKLPKNIVGISRTENIRELVELYSAADVYVNLSVEETFGMTTIEALSCGTPVIVYNSTASPELINEKVGFVVEVGDVDDLYKKINIIKKRGRVFYQNECRKYTIENFNQEDRYEEYFNLYKRLLSKK